MHSRRVGMHSGAGRGCGWGAGMERVVAGVTRGEAGTTCMKAEEGGRPGVVLRGAGVVQTRI